MESSMSMTEIAMFVGLAALVIAMQLGRHAYTARRLLLPLVAVALVGKSYLQSIPTAGGDLEFEVAFAAAGAACGLFAASLVRVDRDAVSGRAFTVAGAGYAAVWLAVFGGRMAFAFAATHGWSAAVRQFSIDHAITGSSAWTAAFVLMALSMVVARTGAIAVRAFLTQPRAARVALPQLTGM
jgi:thiamine transporter ThiT